MGALADVYGTLLIVRAPVPVTVNKAGANYKSEVTHTEYSPRRAFDEWISILDAIIACGGDALFQLEGQDEPFLDHEELFVDGDGAVYPAGSRERLGNLDDIMTGRVFAANGPWVTVSGRALRAVMPNMLAHRNAEGPYYRSVLGAIAAEMNVRLDMIENPHRWEGMADVAVVGDRAVLTYAVPGHYDHATTPKSARSSRAGVEFAATQSGVALPQCMFAELVYPHFHGDTVHFGARPTREPPALVHYNGGLYGADAGLVLEAFGDRIVPISREDAVEHYAGNSRQVGDGLLVPDGVSDDFVATMQGLGLTVHRVPLFELFGKAGGGPACATLYLPTTIHVDARSPLRYSASRPTVRSRRDRVPERLNVDFEFFATKPRG